MNKRFKKHSSLYEWISCVIPDRIYFGPMPNEFMLHELYLKKFTTIVNVTENAYFNPYPPDDGGGRVDILHFPIEDTSIPDNSIEYCTFIMKLKQIYDSGSKMYIHCLGGHSRSSMVVVSLLFCMYNEELKDIVNKVIRYHRNRVKLRDIWQFRSPFNYKQFSFLCMIHKNIYINLDADSKVYNWLCPKNICDDKISMHEYLKGGGNDIQYCLDMLWKNSWMFERIRNTYLKKMIFVSDNPILGFFYDNFFKSVREMLCSGVTPITEQSQCQAILGSYDGPNVDLTSCQDLLNVELPTSLLPNIH